MEVGRGLEGGGEGEGGKEEVEGKGGQIGRQGDAEPINFPPAAYQSCPLTLSVSADDTLSFHRRSISREGGGGGEKRKCVFWERERERERESTTPGGRLLSKFPPPAERRGGAEGAPQVSFALEPLSPRRARRGGSV